MNEQAITSRFRAHDCAGNTVEQNKRLIVPHILRARSPREYWKGGNIVQGKPGWNQTEWSEGDLVIENKYTETTWQWATNLFQNGLQRRPGKYIWRNVLAQPQMDPFYAGMRWGCREYNVSDRYFIDCDFFANANSHGAYVSPYEDTTFDRCTFIRCGAQGLQVAYRPLPFQQYGPDNRAHEKRPTHILRDSHFIDCGETGPSASFSASYFNPGSQEFKGTLLVENCSFVSRFKEGFGYKDWQSRGALLVSPMQGNPVMDTNMMAHVEVKNCLFDYTKGDRPIALIRATDNIVFEDCLFIARDYGGVIQIDSANGYTGSSKSRRITLRNCKVEGDVRLRVDPAGEKLNWNDWLVDIDVNTEGREIVIDCETGAIISDRALNTEPSPEAVEELRKTREDYFGS